MDRKAENRYRKAVYAVAITGFVAQVIRAVFWFNADWEHERFDVFTNRKEGTP